MVVQEVTRFLHSLEIDQAKSKALFKAIDSLSRYKFMMFGYHAALWVSLNALAKRPGRNPFKPFVLLARDIRSQLESTTE